MAQPKLRGSLIGQAILDFLINRPDITDLALVSCDWMKHMLSPDQAYPANPYLLCPRIFLRYHGGSLDAGPPTGGTRHKTSDAYSLYYQRRQTPGQDHQLLLYQGLEAISNQFTMMSLQPASISDVSQYNLISAIPVQLSDHDELIHESLDPNLTISMGEIQLKVEGYINSCV